MSRRSKLIAKLGAAQFRSSCRGDDGDDDGTIINNTDFVSASPPCSINNSTLDTSENDLNDFNPGYVEVFPSEIISSEKTEYTIDQQGFLVKLDQNVNASVADNVEMVILENLKNVNEEPRVTTEYMDDQDEFPIQLNTDVNESSTNDVQEVLLEALEHNNDEELRSVDPDVDYQNNNNPSELICVDAKTNSEDDLHPLVEEITKKKVYPKKMTPGRKRKRNEKDWQFNIAKRKRNLGEEYQSYVTKKIVPAREIRASDCKDRKCRLNCHKKISEEDRAKLFKNFWKLGNHNKHSDFLSKHIKRTAKKVTTIKNSSRRNYSFEYYLTVGEDLIRVCKSFFLRTLDINDMWIRTTYKKIDRSEIGVGSPDNRGKIIKRRNPDLENIKKTIREHIDCFPRMESHYIRNDSAREYLQVDIQSVNQMYRLYKEWISSKKVKQIATLRQYREVFLNEYNIGFFLPKKDQCDVCDSFGLATDEDKSKMQPEFDKHMEMKKAVRTLKNQDKEEAQKNNEICIASYDLQKVLTTPYKEVSIFYYKLKYSTYNFTIFDIGQSTGYCYVWHETIAKRGANEIGSNVYDFIKSRSKAGVKSFVFYTDNCGGQNKNRYIFALYSYISHKLKVDITHRFLEKGHTQNEGDSMHALIERNKKGKVIYTPDQWVMLIKMSKMDGNPYIVNEVSQDDIFDLKKLVLKSQNWSADEKGNQVRWKDVREIKINKDNPNILCLKYDFNDPEMSTTVHLQKKNTSKGKKHNAGITLSKAYSKLIPISKKKYDHLKYLCEKSVPKTYHSFYENLPYVDKQRHDNDMESDNDEV